MHRTLQRFRSASLRRWRRRGASQHRVRLTKCESQDDPSGLFFFCEGPQSEFGDRTVISFQQDRNGLWIEVWAFA
jgi:hypothetical protein